MNGDEASAELIEQLLDGGPIDWQQAANAGAGWLEALRTLEAVRGIHAIGNGVTQNDISLSDADLLAAVKILAQAKALPEHEQEGFVANTCADNPALQAAIQHLLALDGPVAMPGPAADGEAPAIQDDAAEAGRLVGPFRLVRKLGQGGMGSVWLAEREGEGFSQTVALKLIKLGMDSRAIQAQFLRERAVLARLRHPNIAHLIDGGVDERGRPWFAMERVEGVTLREWLAQAPSLRARLELFIKLCRAVAHAHQQLVVHRDLKPDNIMVQADGEPQLLDFGIAKLLEDDGSAATRTQVRFVTRAYAAPEQLEGGPVSTVTDVYALGALLFEILTAARFSDVRKPGTRITAPSHQVAREHDTKPALPANLLRGDLDAITLRALAEEPERRYPSAAALANDIRRYLDGRPVTARPDSFAYRARRFLRRNRGISLAAACAVLALVIGLGASLWQADRAIREAQRANTVKAYLIGLFDAGRTNVSGAAALHRRVIDVLEDSAARLKDELSGQPELRDEIYTILIEIFDSNEAGERSGELARERLEQAERAFGADDARIVPALLMRAGVQLNHREEVETIPAMLDRAQSLLDRGGRGDTLSQALLWRYRAQIMAIELGDAAPGLELLARSNELLRRHHPESDDLLVNLFISAQHAGAAKRVEQALASIDELRQRARALHGEHHHAIGQANLMEGALLLQSGQPQAALEAIHAARAQVEHFSGRAHNDALFARIYEIRALIALDRLDEADAAWQEVEALRTEHFPDSEMFARLIGRERERIDGARGVGRQAE